MPREPLEHVQAALRADEREPLRMTTARMENAMKSKVARWMLLGSLVAGGVGTAHETGALDLLFTRAAVDPRVDVLAKRTANTERLVRWLVRQEIRRQAREGGIQAEPPEDVE